MSIATDIRQESETEVRPWGSWQVLGEGPGFKVKRINVHGHARLSLQTHARRAEHWIVVSGVATCTVGDRQVELRAGESIDVPLGARHRIANRTVRDLVLVEVQLGSYTGEDDIVRLEDDYGR